MTSNMNVKHYHYGAMVGELNIDTETNQVYLPWNKLIEMSNGNNDRFIAVTVFHFQSHDTITYTHYISLYHLSDRVVISMARKTNDGVELFRMVREHYLTGEMVLLGEYTEHEQGLILGPSTDDYEVMLNVETFPDGELKKIHI